jgi:EmrB/QacA subfamily drug resistance transporter
MTRSTWVLLLTSTASLMVALDILAVSTALSTIRRSLHADISELEWTVTAYSLTFAVLLLAASALGDRFGRRRMFAIGLGTFSAASAGCAVAPDINWLIAARTAQGVGAALVLPLGLALISATFPPERRGRALGICGGVTGLTTLAGPLVGGFITQTASWQWIFWVNVPIGAVTVILVLRYFDESFGSDSTVDVPGLLLGTGSVFGIVWALVRVNDTSWRTPDVVAGLAGGLLLALAFLAWERRAAEPLLPLNYFGSRRFTAANAASFCHAVAVLGPVFLMAQFLQTVLGYGPAGAGLRLLPWTATMLAVAPLAGALTDRIGPRAVMVTGLLLAAGGMAITSAMAGPHVAYAHLVGPLTIWGIGNSMVFPASQSAVMAAIPPAAAGKAAGVNSTVREVGGVFGIALLVAVFAHVGGYANSSTFATGFAAAIAVCAGIALLGAILSLGVGTAIVAEPGTHVGLPAT